MTTLNRRGMLLGTAGLLAAAATRRPAYAQAPAGPFTLPPLRLREQRE